MNKMRTITWVVCAAVASIPGVAHATTYLDQTGRVISRAEAERIVGARCTGTLACTVWGSPTEGGSRATQWGSGAETGILYCYESTWAPRHGSGTPGRGPCQDHLTYVSIADQFVSAHNFHRIRHQATPPVSWSPTIASSAQQAANRCVTSHSTTTYGENMIFGNIQTARDVVDAWYAESRNYDYNHIEPNNRDWWAKVAHFTAVVWKSTTQIGCAMAKCPNIYTPGPAGTNDKVWVCQYSPPGNNSGTVPENVRPPR